MSEAEKQLTHKKQLKELCLNRKHTLDLFPEHGAISKEQYDKSPGDLTKKMGMENEA